MDVFSEPKNDRCFGRMRIEIPCLEWGHAAILTFLNSSNETNRGPRSGIEAEPAPCLLPEGAVHKGLL